jgi:hypothetical protein
MSDQPINIKSFGAVCDGTTDDTSAWQSALASIGSNSATLLVPGPSRISANLTIGFKTELKFYDGCSIIGASGSEVIQIQRQIDAGPYQIFSNCVTIATRGMTVLVEWFGAVGDGATDDKLAIQRALDFLQNTGGEVLFDAVTYFLSANVNIGNNTAGSAYQNIVLEGKGRHSTVLQMTDANASAIQIVGVAGYALQGIAIRNLTITKPTAGTGGVGIFSEYSAGLLVQNVQITGFLYGVSILRATNSIFEKVTATFDGGTSGWRGFDLNGGGTGAGGNASCVFRDCYVDGTGSTASGYGFIAYGQYVSDLQFLSCETQHCPVGYQFDMTQSVAAGNEDVQMINCRADSITEYGVAVLGAGSTGSPDSMVNIFGGWFNSLSTLAEVDLIYLSNCQDVTVQGAQIWSVNGANFTYQIKALNCQGCKFLGNTHREFKFGVYLSGGKANRVADSDFYCSSANPAVQMVAGDLESYSVANDNTFRGYAMNAAVFDTNCVACGISGNNADPTNIQSPRYSNGSTGASVLANNVGV